MLRQGGGAAERTGGCCKEAGERLVPPVRGRRPADGSRRDTGRKRASSVPMSRPVPGRATLRGKYFTHLPILSSPHRPRSPMEPPGRRYLCAHCRCAVLICCRCDRGQRYCADGCAKVARANSVRAAGQRYQASPRGRHAHAARQRRYRLRQEKVTHHGSPPPPPPALLPSDPTTPKTSVSPPPRHCHFCGKEQVEAVRQGFLRGRIRRPSPPSDRRKNIHGPVP